MSVAMLFPGQGAQRPGMLAGLPHTPAAAAAWEEACECLAQVGVTPAGLDSADALRSTTNAQLALLVAGIVTARALIDDHEIPVDGVAGHSVGAFGAAVVAGVLTVADAISVVKIRGDAMARACAGGSWAMAALRGMHPRAARSLLDRAATDDDPLWIANINASDQLVVSGTRRALDRLRELAPAAGARDLTLLDVSVASHCPIQADTARAVADALDDVDLGRPERAYFANTTGRRIVDDAARVAVDLAQAVRHPVRWYDIVALMPEVGVTATVQVPPGHVLAAIVGRETPDVLSVAVDDIGIAATVRRGRSVAGT